MVFVRDSDNPNYLGTRLTLPENCLCSNLQRFSKMWPTNINTITEKAPRQLFFQLIWFRCNNHTVITTRLLEDFYLSRFQFALQNNQFYKNKTSHSQSTYSIFEVFECRETWVINVHVSARISSFDQLLNGYHDVLSTQRETLSMVGLYVGEVTRRFIYRLWCFSITVNQHRFVGVSLRFFWCELVI